MTPACPKPTKNQSYAEPVQLSRPEYPSQSPTHHADTQISPITLKSSASKTPREKSGCKLLADCGGEPAPATGKGPPALAGKSTLNRIEHAWDTGDRRYHQISANLKKLSNLFVTLFLDAHQTPPARITLDINATDVETHGRQENAFFHGYYEHRCFLPLYVFCGRHLLLAQLRPANIDGARGARNQIRRIVRMIRERWPNLDILLRGDSGFARENPMRWCEGNAVDYVFGLARNEALLKKARHAGSKAAMAMIETGQPARAYGDFHHMTKSRSWGRPRRVIAKVDALPLPRHLPQSPSTRISHHGGEY